MALAVLGAGSCWNRSIPSEVVGETKKPTSRRPMMDRMSFDTLSKTVSERMTRRTAVRGLVAGALAAVVGVSTLHD